MSNKQTCKTLFTLAGYPLSEFESYCRIVRKLRAVQTMTDLGIIKAYLENNEMDISSYLNKMLSVNCKWIKPVGDGKKLPSRLRIPTRSDAIPVGAKEDLVSLLLAVLDELPVPMDDDEKVKFTNMFTVRGDTVFDPSGIRYARCDSTEAAHRIKGLLNKDLTKSLKIM